MYKEQVWRSSVNVKHLHWRTAFEFSLPLCSRSQNNKKKLLALFLLNQRCVPVMKQMLNDVSDANVRHE